MSFFKKSAPPIDQPQEITTMFDSLEENINYIQTQLNFSDDLLMKEVAYKESKGIIIYLDTMIDTNQFQRIFLSPITEMKFYEQMDNLIASPNTNQSNNLDDVVNGILKGDCAVIIDKEPTIYLFNIIQSNARSPEEPDGEKTVYGSHTGFVENLDINLNLIRNRVQNRQLKIENVTLGTQENSTVALIYLNNIADPTLVQKVRKRINAVTSDMIFPPGYLKEDIENRSFTLFQEVLYTERPDRVEANLIEGRVAILNEGSSEAMIAPVSFFTYFQSVDDYSVSTLSGSFFRVLRLFSFLSALLLPPLYIAIISFHFEFISYDLIQLVKGSINNIPFPPLLEAFIMLITIELIREAAIRLPTPIGQSIGIVGGLIIGDAIVNAGLVSNFMVIIIAITAIMSFTIPNYEMANTVRLLSYPLMIGAATLGLVGIIFVGMMLLIHLCTLSSFGTPYLSPLVPTRFKDLQDAILRLPNWLAKDRPKDLHTKNEIRRGKSRGWDKHGK